MASNLKESGKTGIEAESRGQVSNEIEWAQAQKSI